MKHSCVKNGKNDSFEILFSLCTSAFDTYRNIYDQILSFLKLKGGNVIFVNLSLKITVSIRMYFLKGTPCSLDLLKCQKISIIFRLKIITVS